MRLLASNPISEPQFAGAIEHFLGEWVNRALHAKCKEDAIAPPSKTQRKRGLALKLAH